MRFEVLGPLRIVADDGAVISPTSQRHRAVLAMLLMADGRTVPVDRLIETVWGDQLPANPTNTLQQTITQLRKLLEPNRSRSEPPRILLSTDASYQLALDDHQLDTDEADQAIAHAAQLLEGGRPADALTAARKALVLWRGTEAFADVDDSPAIEGERRRWAERRIEARELALDCRMAIDGPEAAIADLEALTLEMPNRDGLWSRLMTALYQAGRQADALQAFQRASDAAGELGLVVSPALRDLEQQILLQDPEIRPAEHSGSVRTNLPSATGPLIGRDQALAEIVERLDQARLVTLTGPGGSGKTSLALEAARALARRPTGPSAGPGPGRHPVPEAVWLIRLDDLSDAELLEPSVASVVGMPESGDQPIRQALSGYLASRAALLVFDNCEHLLGPVADLTSHLLAACPALTILATSQAPLSVRGEHRIPVSPLGLPGDSGDPFTDLEEAPAVQLFLERARQADPSIDTDGFDLPAIVNIVRVLDGMPLAIELAAARTRSLSVADIARLLADGFELLTGGQADAPQRQQTLAATIEWSYQLLDDEERQAFTMLSVFSGGFDGAVAAWLLGTDELDAQDMIDRLVACSIVTRTEPVAGRSRFGLLAMLRGFGLAELGRAGGIDAARHRHAELFATQAVALDDALRGPEQGEAMARLVADEDNFRAAMAWSLEAGAVNPSHLAPGVVIVGRLGRFWDWQGDLAEAITWLRRFVPGLEASAPPVEDLWLARSWEAFFAAELGELDQSAASSRAAAELAAEIDDPYVSMVAASGQSLRSRQAGTPAESLADADRMHQLATGLDKPWWIALANNFRALAHLDLGDLETAEEAAERSNQQFSTVGDIRALGWAQTAQAQIALAKGDLEPAKAMAATAAATSIAAGDGRNAGWALQIGATVAERLSDRTAAAELEAQAEAVLSARGMAISLWQRE